MQAAWHIGITGGMGSGKSTVTNILAQHHAYIIDADKITHACTSNNGAAIQPIRQAFGAHYVDAQGNMCKDAMRNMIFQNPRARRTLESIIHPLVLQQALNQAHMAERNNFSFIFYELPLLTESAHWSRRLHAIWVVECDYETQIQRCMQRSTLQRSQIEAILKQQTSHIQRRNIADAVIMNDANTNIVQLTIQINALMVDFGCIMRTGGNTQ